MHLLILSNEASHIVEIHKENYEWWSSKESLQSRTLEEFNFHSQAFLYDYFSHYGPLMLLWSKCISIAHYLSINLDFKHIQNWR